MEVNILKVMRTSKRTIKRALGSIAGAPEVRAIPRWNHVAIHSYRCEEGKSYRETESRLECFSELRDILELNPDELPVVTTIYKSFDRFEMCVWRSLFRVAAKLTPEVKVCRS